MDITSKIQFVVGLIASALVTGAWWYAALKKRDVAIFYWLAATHSLSCGMHLLVLIYVFTGVTGRLFAMSSVQNLVSLIMAGLYVALVRWLIRQP